LKRSRPTVGFDSRCSPGRRIKHLIDELGIADIADPDSGQCWLLAEEQGRLVLLERDNPRGKPLSVDLVKIRKRFKSLPIRKHGPMARALGRSTRTIIDATAGWGQDTFLIWMMGYDVVAVERSLVIGALLIDGMQRFQRTESSPRCPHVIVADSIEFLQRNNADCVYLDPMFPPRKKMSALARRSMRVLRELVGDDNDRDRLFERAWQAASRRVVVKRPNYSKPWRTPDQTFVGKLMSYDLFLKHG